LTTFCGPAANFENVVTYFHKEIKMTTGTAAEARRLLANAHAKWFSAENSNGNFDLNHVLTETGTIGKNDTVQELAVDGTTLCILLESGELLELDAYGNVVRGQK
jgi:hypothetical protein